MKRVVIIGVLLLIFGGSAWFLVNRKEFLSPRGTSQDLSVRDHSLQKYDFDELKKRGGVASPITIVGEATDIEKRRAAFASARSKMKLLEKKYEIKSSLISFISDGKKITGLMNVPYVGAQNFAPQHTDRYPIIIMIRGYADKPGYYTGFGTWRAADELAYQGFITVSLDFLGYAGSDQESLDMMGARFEKVPAVMDFIESVKQLPQVDAGKIGIWAHSNGGQIALSVLEATGGNYPTVLWAPMTNPFPQSIIDTESTLDDGGAAVKAELDAFEKNYDPRRYAFENYYQWINAPVKILQGTKDEWCQVSWQQAVVDKMKAAGKQASLSVYPGDDHNLSQGWDKAVVESINWITSKF